MTIMAAIDRPSHQVPQNHADDADLRLLMDAPTSTVIRHYARKWRVSHRDVVRRIVRDYDETGPSWSAGPGEISELIGALRRHLGDLSTRLAPTPEGASPAVVQLTRIEQLLERTLYLAALSTGFAQRIWMDSAEATPEKQLELISQFQERLFKIERSIALSAAAKLIRETGV